MMIATVRKSTRILIVEDYREMSRLIRTALEKLGFQAIVEVADAATALRALREEQFDLVISDYNMRPMNGLVLLREIRTDVKLTATPFVMISGSGDSDVVAATKQLGVNAYIVKPFTVKTLKSRLTAVLGEF